MYKNVPSYSSELFTQKNCVSLRLIYFHLYLDLKSGACHFQKKYYVLQCALYLNQIICVGGFRWIRTQESDTFHFHSGGLATNSDLPSVLWRVLNYLKQPTVLFKTLSSTKIKLNYT